MIEWWGPVLREYYAGTESNGMCFIRSEEWLKKPGSVGKAIFGEVKICDEAGEELPIGVDGTIFFANGLDFAYHNDPGKTEQSRNQYGWTTLGDVGRLDEDGYLYLTDRRAFMIISGGVNIYPQEVDNEIIKHPVVEDVCTIGVPNREWGEEVKSVVMLKAGTKASEDLKKEIIEFVRPKLAGFKVPRSIDFVAELPRSAAGKIQRKKVREPFWEGRKVQI
jgi:long-chain acyl-CoA synthetase